MVVVVVREEVAAMEESKTGVLGGGAGGGLPPRPSTAGRRRSALDNVGDLADALPYQPHGAQPPPPPAEQLRQSVANDSLLRILSEPDAQLDSEFLVLAESGNLAGVQKMLEAGYGSHLGRKESPPCGLNGYTALHHACNRGHAAVVSELLRAHPSLIHLSTNAGDSPLHLSVYSGNLLLVEQLLDRGARINVANNEGETPLFYAARKGMPALVRLLLQRGADASLRDRFGDQAPDHAEDARTRSAFESTSALADSSDRTRIGYEELLHVFRFLDMREVCRAACVAGKWHRVSEAPELWSKFGVRRWEASLQATLGLATLAPTGMSFLSRPAARRPSKDLKRPPL